MAITQTHAHIRGGGQVHNSSFVDPTAYVWGTATVGERSFVGMGSYLSPAVVVGDDVIICEQVRIGFNTVIGNGATIGSNNVIPPNSVIAADAVLPAVGGAATAGSLMLGLLGQYLSNGHALSGLDPLKTEFLWDPFYHLPVNGANWVEVLTGTGATATNGVNVDGGAANLVAGAAGTYAMNMNAVVNLTQFFTATDSRWYAAFRAKLAAVPAAGQSINMGFANAGLTVRLGIGVDGTTSTTQWCLMINGGGVVIPGVLDAATYHTFEVWNDNTGSFKGRVDGGAIGSRATGSIAAFQSKASILCTNMTLSIDAGLWLGPSTLT